MTSNITRKKVWKDTIPLHLTRILDVAREMRERKLSPFWSAESQEVSENLWLPREIGTHARVPNGASWFSLVKKEPGTKVQNSPFTYKPPKPSQEKPSLRTLKIRIFPTKTEQEQLKVLFEQFRWYYNATVSIVGSHYSGEDVEKPKKYRFETIRALMRNYEYAKDTVGDRDIQYFIYNEDRKEVPVPPWWTSVPNRVPRGAVEKYVSSLNSAISNYKAGNNSGFKMHYMSRKKKTEYVHFEDKGYPAWIRSIPSRYWYRTRDRKRKQVPFSEINQGKGLDIIYEKDTKKYYFHYPVEVGWYPKDDLRNERQATYTYKGDRIISLDPGVRKFLVGYDPSGSSVFIGEGACAEISKLVLEKRWREARNKVSELHWKTASFLVENYDTILLPEFKISQMVRRGNKISSETKRLLYAFSFHSFKEKLHYKCAVYNKNLVIVDESYTSCTCGNCGMITRMKGAEMYKCPHCGLEMDRDVMASRNILIKNINYTPYAMGNSDFSGLK